MKYRYYLKGKWWYRNIPRHLTKKYFSLKDKNDIDCITIPLNKHCITSIHYKYNTSNDDWDDWFPCPIKDKLIAILRRKIAGRKLSQIKRKWIKDF